MNSTVVEAKSQDRGRCPTESLPRKARPFAPSLRSQGLTKTRDYGYGLGRYGQTLELAKPRTILWEGERWEVVWDRGWFVYSKSPRGNDEKGR